MYNWFLPQVLKFVTFSGRAGNTTLVGNIFLMDRSGVLSHSLAESAVQGRIGAGKGTPVRDIMVPVVVSLVRRSFSGGSNLVV